MKINIEEDRSELITMMKNTEIDGGGNLIFHDSSPSIIVASLTNTLAKEISNTRSYLMMEKRKILGGEFGERRNNRALAKYCWVN